MTVRLSVSFAATDGAVPENVEVEWGGPADPDADDVVHVMQAVAGLSERRDYASARPDPSAYPQTGFVAKESADRGTLMAVTGGKAHEVRKVVLPLTDPPPSWMATAAVRVVAGDRLVFHPTDPMLAIAGPVWRVA